jgi:hypothetical protein
MLSVEIASARLRLSLVIGNREGDRVVNWNEIAQKKQAERELLAGIRESRGRHFGEFAAALPLYAGRLFDAISAEVEKGNKLANPGSTIVLNRSPMSLACRKTSDPAGRLAIKINEPSDATSSTTCEATVWGWSADATAEVTEEFKYLVTLSGREVTARQIEGHVLPADTSEMSIDQIAGQLLERFVYLIS